MKNVSEVKTERDGGGVWSTRVADHPVRSDRVLVTSVYVPTGDSRPTRVIKENVARDAVDSWSPKQEWVNSLSNSNRQSARAIRERSTP